MGIRTQLFWNKWSERAQLWAAYHLVPRSVRRWIVVRAFAATTAVYRDKEPDQITYSMVMKVMDGQETGDAPAAENTAGA